MLRKNKGFTLIELLIVIALLGALAVALLAALDPLEQIRKGTDTGVRNTVAEIHSGATRYAALNSGVMPFASTGTIGWINAGSAEGSALIQKIIDAGELKTDFMKLAGTSQLNRIWMTGINGDSDYKIAVCYKPQAKSFRTDANTKFATTQPGEPYEFTTTGLNTCPNSGGMTGGTTGTDCYWCVR